MVRGFCRDTPPPKYTAGNTPSLAQGREDSFFQGADCAVCFFTQNKAFQPHNVDITCPAEFAPDQLYTSTMFAQIAPLTLRHRRVWFMWGWAAIPHGRQCALRTASPPNFIITFAGTMPLNAQILFYRKTHGTHRSALGETGLQARYRRTRVTDGKPPPP